MLALPAVALALSLASTATPSPSPIPTPAVVLVFDLRRPPPSAVGTAARQGVFAFSGADVGAWTRAACPAEADADTVTPLSQLAPRLNCFLNAENDVHVRASAARDIGSIAIASPGDSRLRHVTERGDVVRTIVLFDAVLLDGSNWVIQGPEVKLGFEERARRSRLDTDLATLITLALQVAAPTRAASEEVTWLAVQDYRLQSERATLAVEASLSEELAEVASATDPPALAGGLRTRASSAGPPPRPPLKTELVTGAREHWFLSADVPVTAASQLKQNAQTGQVELAKEPSTFYVGVNFLLGDLLASRQTVADVLGVKLLAKASRRPLDSVGIGLSLRGRYLKRYGLDFDVVSPFVGYTFTLEDRAAGDGTVHSDGGRNSEVRFGIGLNLDQALRWVKAAPKK